MFNTAGAVSPGGSVTLGTGVGDGGEVLHGLHGTVSLYNLGYDLVSEDVAGAFGGGVEYFQQPQEEGKAMGFRVGVESGGAFTPNIDAVFVAGSVGARYAIVNDRDFPFVDLGGLLGGAIGVEDEGDASPSGLLAMVGFSFGWLSVRSFRL